MSVASEGNARLYVQIDVGMGDAVVPEPDWLEYPALLDFPRPRLRAYHQVTAIAEKLHAMVVLGEANSRMRDFFDIFALADRGSFDGEALVHAVGATFARRGTPIPDALPFALTPAFAALPTKQTQWRGFRRTSGVRTAPDDFDTAVAGIAAFVEPALAAAQRGVSFHATWPAGGPWSRT